MRIFIGSSMAAKRQAHVIASHFESGTVEFVRWWDAFTPGRTLLQDLDALAENVDAAVLVMSPEIPASVRGNDVLLPNQNVLFEFGYFYGKLGPSRTALVPYGNFYMPTDLNGYTHITGSKFFKPGSGVKVGKRTETTFNRWLSAS
jgi:CRP/FNR family cyclic AMP-dependent transcriptional regulator